MNYPYKYVFARNTSYFGIVHGSFFNQKGHRTYFEFPKIKNKKICIRFSKIHYKAICHSDGLYEYQNQFLSLLVFCGCFGTRRSWSRGQRTYDLFRIYVSIQLEYVFSIKLRFPSPFNSVIFLSYIKISSLIEKKNIKVTTLRNRPQSGERESPSHIALHFLQLGLSPKNDARKRNTGYQQ